jgi:hypothetical protein
VPRLPRLPRPRPPRKALGAVGTAFRAIGRALRRILGIFPAAARAIRRFWFGRSLAFRRRFAAVLLVLGLYVVFRLVALPGVPCEVSPAKECPPTDDAIGFVPAESYAYAHLNLDRDSSQFEEALDQLGKLPHPGAIAQGTFEVLGPGRTLDLTLDVYPWLGDELAAAEVPGETAAPESLLIAAVADRRAAGAFLAKAGGANPSTRSHDGVEISLY